MDYNFFFIFQKNLLCPLNYPPVQLGHQTKEQILLTTVLSKMDRLAIQMVSNVASLYIIQVKNYETCFFSQKLGYNCMKQHIHVLLRSYI